MNGELRAELARFDAALPVERAWTPPASWYVDPHVLRREADTVFARHWVAVERADLVAPPTAYAASHIANRPVVLVRDSAGALRAFHNVCRHHAAAVANGSGHCTQLVCPYHGWSYELDGRLARAPRSGGIEGFAREDFGLVPLGASTLGPLALVHGSVDAAPPLADHPAVTAAVDATGLRWVARREYRLHCNWKVFVDNYLDGGYHVPVLHRGLSAQLDLDSYRTECFAGGVVQSCAGGGDPNARTGARALYVWLYPNVMLNRYGPVLDTNVVLPLAVDETAVLFDWYVSAERAGDADFVQHCLDASDGVQREDESICAAVQRGLASTAYDRGRYAPKLEAGMHHFHRMLAADLQR